MTQRSIIVGVEGEGGRARAETWTQLDYAGHHRPPPVDGPTEARGLSTSNMSLTLNTSPSQSSIALTFPIQISLENEKKFSVGLKVLSSKI